MPDSATARHKGHRASLAHGFVGDRLREDLRRHALAAQPHERLQSERNLARAYQISHSTVRRVIADLVQEGVLYKAHGRGIFVADRKRERPVTQKTILYADDWPDMEHAFCIRKLRGILEGAQEGHFRVQVYNQALGGRFVLENSALLEDIAREDVAGIIVSWITPSLFREIRAQNPELAIVSTHSVLPEENLASVVQDWHTAGYQAVQYLLRRQARSIILAHGRPAFLQGAQTAAESQPRTTLLQPLSLKGEGDVAEVCRFIQEKCPDGLAFDDDRRALAVLQALREEHPEQASVPAISIANVGENLLPPHVARLNIDGYEVGRVAVTALRALIEGQPHGRTAIQIKPHLVEPDTH